MLALIMGGSASGKSAYAEELIQRRAGGAPLVYLATMEAQGGESAARIVRHREMRSGKGFRTVERPLDLSDPAFTGSAVLLEDLGNLLANHLFRTDAPKGDIFERLDGALRTLERAAAHLVVVSGDVHRDGVIYSAQSAAYQETLARLHTALAQRYDVAAEVVCGIPIFWKGGGA